jgi:hypothetical protein
LFYTENPNPIKEQIPELAYHISTSPFQFSWVRFGYDPAEHPQARFLQVLMFIVTTDKMTIIIERIKEFLGKYKNVVTSIDLDTMSLSTLKTGDFSQQARKVQGLLAIKYLRGTLNRQNHIQVYVIKCR